MFSYLNIFFGASMSLSLKKIVSRSRGGRNRREDYMVNNRILTNKVKVQIANQPPFIESSCEIREKPKIGKR